jgi:hypothetical protein
LRVVSRAFSVPARVPRRRWGSCDQGLLSTADPGDVDLVLDTDADLAGRGTGGLPVGQAAQEGPPTLRGARRSI